MTCIIDKFDLLKKMREIIAHFHLHRKLRQHAEKKDETFCIKYKPDLNLQHIVRTM